MRAVQEKLLYEQRVNTTLEHMYKKANRQCSKRKILLQVVPGGFLKDILCGSFRRAAPFVEHLPNKKKLL